MPFPPLGFFARTCNFVWVLLLLLSVSSHSYELSSTAELHGYTAMSDFRVLNRRTLAECPDPNPYLQINITSNSTLSNEEFVTVTVSGVLLPAASDWVAMVSPSHSDVSTCIKNAVQYLQTGDFSTLPLLCHYPVKAQYMSNDPAYLDCKKKECQKLKDGICLVKTCSGSIKFHVVNFRTDVEFIFFAGGFLTPCMLKRSSPVRFANPQMPLYGHLSSIDSTGKAMRLTWVSGDGNPQQLQYSDGKSVTSQVTTFTQKDMCNTSYMQSPAKDFGWHDPGHIHSAVMEGLQPSQSYTYRYGSNSVGWSDYIKFRTPPAGGSDELRFIAFGDMGKAPRDPSAEHFIQPGSLSVVKAMAGEVELGNVDSIFHIGDISYATGFLVEWDYFLQLITQLGSRVSYMTAIGNHERDYGDSGSVYGTPDSGGECGVPYETYFPMPTQAKDKPWYSIEQASVHFTVISTEHAWDSASEQYVWIKKDLGSVDRSRTPWVVFAGHRPMYSSSSSGDSSFVNAIEPLLMDYKVGHPDQGNQDSDSSTGLPCVVEAVDSTKHQWLFHIVDLVLFGHVHNYERTCAVYQNDCKAMPAKDKDGVDTYNARNYSAPVHAIIGMAGFSLDNFPSVGGRWSLVRITEFGYIRVHATKQEMRVQFVNASSGHVQDSFQLTK